MIRNLLGYENDVELALEMQSFHGDWRVSCEISRKFSLSINCEFLSLEDEETKGWFCYLMVFRGERKWKRNSAWERESVCV